MVNDAAISIETVRYTRIFYYVKHNAACLLSYKINEKNSNITTEISQTELYGLPLPKKKINNKIYCVHINGMHCFICACIILVDIYYLECTKFYVYKYIYSYFHIKVKCIQ